MQKAEELNLRPGVRVRQKITGLEFIVLRTTKRGVYVIGMSKPINPDSLIPVSDEE